MENVNKTEPILFTAKTLTFLLAVINLLIHNTHLMVYHNHTAYKGDRIMTKLNVALHSSGDCPASYTMGTGDKVAVISIQCRG
jgi:hypothetical protein